MLRTFLAVLIFISTVSHVYAIQSTIMEAEGYACMGDDKSRKQTEQQSMADAKRNAVENVLTYVKSETKVKDFQIEDDIMKAYANASVKILEVKESRWYKDERSGDCLKTKIKAEVIPDEKAIKEAVSSKVPFDSPGMPLNVRLWTDKKEFRKGDKIKIYIQGNKPFYARVHYRDVKGEIVQLLPNPYRTDNYFNGGVIYEIPSGNDRFELEVSPPFGDENISLYASTSPLGEISLSEGGAVYQVTTKETDIGIKTRGIKLKEKSGGGQSQASEFFEERMSVKTRRQ
jgi:hypothetical protein